LLGALRQQCPMVLTVDDLQWADADSAELLTELLRTGQDTPLLVVILYRPAEAADNTSLTAYFALCDKLRSRGQLTELPLGELQLADAQCLAHAALGEAASDERVALVVKEARGVPFFIEELAYYITERAQPGLDANMSLDSSKLSLDSAIMARVEALPADQRRLVEVVAVANSPLPQSVVFEAAALDAGVLMPLLALRSASLVSWLGAGADDTVAAYHDRIRESVLASLSANDTLACHLKLGRALAKRNDGAGARVFDAVRHLGAAAPLLDEAGERRMAAELHATAGELARDAAAFPLAFDCFEGGIALLSDDAWDEDYPLALRLHAGSVEAAYLSANWPALERRAAEVKSRSRNVMDQLVAWEAEIDAHAGRQDYVAAVDTALTVLTMLGIDFPRDPGEAEVGEAITNTLARLTEIGPDGLRALPDLDDPEAAAATRIQVRVSPAAYFGKPMLLPIIACHLVTTSIDRGVSTAPGASWRPGCSTAGPTAASRRPRDTSSTTWCAAGWFRYRPCSIRCAKCSTSAAEPVTTSTLRTRRTDTFTTPYTPVAHFRRCSTRPIISVSRCAHSVRSTRCTCTSLSSSYSRRSLAGWKTRARSTTISSPKSPCSPPLRPPARVVASSCHTISRECCSFTSATQSKRSTAWRRRTDTPMRSLRSGTCPSCTSSPRWQLAAHSSTQTTLRGGNNYALASMRASAH
jgi:hypothetical protein